MKKHLLIVFAFIIAILSFSSCGHEHAWSEWTVTKRATCTAEGEQTRTCECGETEKQTIPAKGHTLGEWVTVRPATSTESGLREQSCTVCDKVVNSEMTSVTGSQGLAFALNSDGTYKVTGIGTCTDTDIVIPSAYNGKAVTCIESYAFEDCGRITSVVIPNSVTKIYNNAFDSCTGLTSVVIPDGVTSIGFCVFTNCTNLTNIVIPENVTEIGSYAFAYCSGLTSIVIPNSVTKIYDCAFFNCINLTSVTLGDNVAELGSSTFDGCRELTSIVIPDGVTSIGDCVFYLCDSLTSVEIPNSVTSIGKSAFGICFDLKNIRFTGTTAQWQAISFANSWNSNTGYYKVTCTDGIVSKGGIVTPFQPETNGSQGLAFTSNGDGTCTVTGIGTCTDTDVVIPSMYNGEKVTNIGQLTFNGCNGLTSVVIPDSVTSIGYGAFAWCTSLTSVTIGNSVEIIDSAAFIHNSSLLTISVDKNNAYYSSVEGVLFNKSKTKLICYPAGKVATLYTVPTGVTTICYEAFTYCDCLVSVVIPDSVNSIGHYAFRSCSNLTGIQFTGTTAVWQSILKGTDWDVNTGIYTVTCTDGTVAKDGTVTLN